MFVKGTDVSKEVNLTDGYFSEWINSDNNKVWIYSKYCYENQKYYYNFMPAESKEEIIAEIKEIANDGFYNCCGYTEEQLEEQDIFMLLSDMQNYYGLYFYGFYTADNINEIINHCLSLSDYQLEKIG